MRAEIKGMESRKIIEKNQQNQNRLFEKINNIDRLLARLKNLKNGEIISIRSETKDITTDPANIKRTTKEYYMQLYTIQQLR